MARVKDAPYLPAGFYLVDDGELTVLMRIGHGAVYSCATRDATEAVLVERATAWTAKRRDRYQGTL